MQCSFTLAPPPAARGSVLAGDYQRAWQSSRYTTYLIWAFDAQAKFPVLKLVVRVNADTIFVRDELNPVEGKMHCVKGGRVGVTV